MKRLLVNTAIFMLPLVILMFIGDWFFSHQLKKSRDGEFSVWNDIYNGKVNADIVVYGSSRAMVHMDPKIIQDSLHANAYNLGLNGHNFWLQYFRHKELLKHNKAPKFIIHSVDVFTLVKRKDLFQMEQFLPYMLYNDELEYWITPYEGFKKYDFKIPLVRYYGQYKTIGKIFKTFISNDEVGDSLRYKGFASKNQVWNDDLVKARKKFPDYRVSLDSTSIRLFDNYLRELRNMGIAVVLVYTPEYIGGQDFVKNRDEIMNTFSTFAQKYNIPFFDYSQDPISFKKEYFYNASHLNGLGAQVFTSKMVHDLKRNETVARFIESNYVIDYQQAFLNAQSLKSE